MSILLSRKSRGNLTDCLEGVVEMKDKAHKLGSELKHRIKWKSVGIAIFAVLIGALCGRYVAAQEASNEVPTQQSLYGNQLWAQRACYLGGSGQAPGAGGYGAQIDSQLPAGNSFWLGDTGNRRRLFPARRLRAAGRAVPAGSSAARRTIPAGRPISARRAKRARRTVSARRAISARRRIPAGRTVPAGRTARRAVPAGRAIRYCSTGHGADIRGSDGDVSAADHYNSRTGF